MAKQTITLHLYEGTGIFNHGDHEVNQSDFREMSGSIMDHRVWIGQTVVEIDWPEIDTRQLQIDALNDQIKSERAASESRVNHLLDRISNLQAIGHDHEVVE